MHSRAHTEPQLQQRRIPDGANEELQGIVFSGLLRNPKRLPSKLLYDQRGSELFEQICEQPEYYLTRTELEIMQSCSGEMASALGRDIMLVEYGSGSSLKTRLLLNRLKQPAAYMPVDISSYALLDSVEWLRREMPDLTVLPLCADFTQSFGALPQFTGASRTVVYFPGSTIGNFEATEAIRLLRRIHLQMGNSGGALIGFDLKKDPAIIERAYNDAAGCTAEFTLNLLQRLNRELHADFDLRNFRHRAVYRQNLGRIETHIISTREQHVRVAEEIVHFERGEEMLVEISCKYSMQNFAVLASRAGLRMQAYWTDPQHQFCVQYLVAD
jgi:dimethylhistidine N-methyltransferase